MATGYQDWHSLTFLQEQSASMYFADVFRMLSEDQVIVEKRVIADSKIFYGWNSLTIQDPGRVICLGSIIILGD